MNVRISPKAIAGRPRVAAMLLTVQRSPRKDKLCSACHSIAIHGALLQRRLSVWLTLRRYL